MKRNQNGVSMVSLVITIIVMIILAAVAFGSSTETISNANFTDFTNDVAEVESWVQNKTITVLGQLKAKGANVTEQQVRNYVAKGGTETTSGEDSHMLPLGMAGAVTATRIEPDTAKKVFENDLPKITVNTAKATKVEVSYFLTKGGKVFVWPPYYNEPEGKYYINKNDTVVFAKASESGDASKYKEAVYSDSLADLNAIFAEDIALKIGDEIVIITDDAAPTAAPTVDGTTSATPAVYYTDSATRSEVKGLETTKMFGES